MIPTQVDAAAVIAAYQQALADTTHRAVLAEAVVAQLSAQLDAAGGDA